MHAEALYLIVPSKKDYERERYEGDYREKPAFEVQHHVATLHVDELKPVGERPVSLRQIAPKELGNEVL